ncbi:DUF1501 domain-containing protein [Pseudoduganella violacea]|uniref:Uncharacterized protein (DUF1501 family) n=1 Tax=Pseudoduganella violacea TaxID=1715466 RepID=A0A7W5BBG4_9BURK|nr:DUF1501 domain-containing protein [Pseudoduganella violacea]MBB3120089.1 uncharacterized protein (DUF1501 family) [Pseudoduganella violacea]
MTPTSPARRRFVSSLLTLAGGAATPMALNLAAIHAAAAASASDYRALVCVFLGGGNDHYNTVLATDRASWAAYQGARNTGGGMSIALAAPGQPGGVLPLTPATPHAGRSFALHPQLPQLRGLFDAGRAAVVANVGTLLAPTSRADYLRRGPLLPPKLFSHNDQQAMWQSCQPEGATHGWGGRLGELLASANSQASFTCISTAGNAVFGAGRLLTPYQISAEGALPVNRLDQPLFANARHPLRAIISNPHSHLLEQEYAAVMRRALEAQALMGAAYAPAGPGGVPNPGNYFSPDAGAPRVNPLAVQLHTVARIIAGRATLGMRRQVFFVHLGGFDTHDFQRNRHAELMARLDHGLAYFDGLMANLRGSNLREQVTLFTASDFGRTLSSNGDGTDHGWGAHHFVLGGAVRGRNLYGAFPPIGLGHDHEVGQGVLLPQFSVEQYGATLASWFGVSAGQLSDIFPNLGNFNSRNLGFMA